MSNPESDADKIRLKRLAKLHSQPQLGSTSSSPTAAPQEKPQTNPSGNDGTLNGGARSETRSPPSVPPASTAVTITQPPAPIAPASSIKNLEDRILSQVFRVTLQPDARGSDTYLERLREELEDEGEQPVLSTRILDQVILMVNSTARKESPFDYLVSCWKRASNLSRSLRTTGNGNDHKAFVLKEAKRMCVSYIVCCLSQPDIFDDVDASVQFSLKLLVDPEDDNGISIELLKEIVESSEETPELDDIFIEAIQDLSTRLSKLDMSSEYKPYNIALNRIISSKKLANMFIRDPMFLPSTVTGPTIETDTLLGPYFRISPCQPKVADVFFSDSKTKSPNVIADATRALRLTLQNIQDELFQITNALVRVSPEARNRTLDFFAKVMNLNQKRTGLQVDPATVATDSFMLNVASVLSRLCEPFMDTGFTKLSKVEVEYMRRNSRLEFSEETKLNADAQASTEYYSKKLEGGSNFISEVFFLSVAAHHYGTGAAEESYKNLGKDLETMEGHLTYLLETRVKWLNTPQLHLYDRQIQRTRDRINKGHAYKHGLEVVLFDEKIQARTLLFLRFLMAWILRLVQPSHKYPQERISLPLPETALQEFTYLPEYFFEIVGARFGWIARYFHHIIFGTQIEELVTFCITFLRMSTYTRNPQLCSKLVEILFWGIQPTRTKANGYLGDAINSNSFALENLMHSLMNFYIEIETQYYHKFTVRYHISQIIQRMWDNPAYRGKLEQESRLNVKFFVRFVALLLNDVTYVMDHSLTALADIHTLQRDLEEPNASALTTEEKEEKEKALDKAEKDAGSYLTLGNETVLMLKLFTAALADAFVMPEIVHRLASMMDYNLDALVGPRCANLKVKQPEKYGFNPKILVGYFAEVYLNLRKKHSFLEAVARDGRSYTPKLFESMQRILTKFEIKSRTEREQLEEMAAEIAKIKQMEDEGELELGEIPDEFLDPLMATLMEDPVILPSSKVTVDRQTIKAHLLSDPKDPFNRSPLKEENVIPNTELKEKIDAFIAERRGVNATNSGDQMEIDT